MVKSINQAYDIQERRASLGKRGIAKAVRRFIRANHSEDYKSVIAEMPVNW